MTQSNGTNEQNAAREPEWGYHNEVGEFIPFGPRCGGTRTIDLGPQGAYSLVGERYVPCLGCPDCQDDDGD